MHREEAYGISWHVMTSGVDAGDLLLQAPVDISESETALSLNTKCMAAAAESFPELMRRLSDGQVERSPQDRSKRSYHGKYKRPPAACAIDWSRSADEIEAFVRALTFGPYSNPVGLPKLFRSDEPTDPIVVASVAIGSGQLEEGVAPGTVLEASDNGVLVATGEGCISVLAGRSLAGADRDARGPDVPQALAAPASGRWGRAPIQVPADLEAGTADPTIAIVTALAVYLTRTGRTERFDLAVPAVSSDVPPGWPPPSH
jgi:methionyl-tRNA formyltransferase